MKIAHGLCWQLFYGCIADGYVSALVAFLIVPPYFVSKWFIFEFL
jgi:hypothetical protein